MAFAEKFAIDGADHNFFLKNCLKYTNTEKERNWHNTNKKVKCQNMHGVEI